MRLENPAHLYITYDESHATPHTSHVTRHTSHVTRHTSHLTLHTSHATCRSRQTDYYPAPGRIARLIFPSWNSYNSIHCALFPLPLLLLLLLLLLLSLAAGYLWLLQDLSWITKNKLLFWIVAVPVTLVSCDMVYTTARKAGDDWCWV